MRIRANYCIGVLFLLWLGTFLPGYGQAPYTQDQIDRLIKKRWKFWLIREQYEYDTAEEMISVIRRCCPHEIDTMLVYGEEILEESGWREALPWFELSLRNAPDHILLNYYYAICKRERGQNVAVFGRSGEWEEAEAYFKRVIATDSTYKDVFYQYALLEHYRENLFKSIEYAHRQLKANPVAYNGQIGIFRLYDYMIHHLKSEESEIWLKSRHTPYDRYFLGELYRITGRLDEAEHVFLSILEGSADFVLPPVFLSLVRLYVQTNRYEEAQSMYWQGAWSVTSQLDADLLLEDILYIVNQKEYNWLKNEVSPMSLPEALQIFWLRRDPLPSIPYNARLMEHYRRILQAESEFYYDDFRHMKYKEDISHEFRFPPWYYENAKFTDMGLIYIRFGEPDDKAFARGRNPDPNDQNVHFNSPLQPNMSWLYNRRDDLPQMVFHFVVPNQAPPEYWTLVPGFSAEELWDSIADWPIRTVGEYMTDRVIDVDTAFQSDRHTWPKETEPLEMAYATARFREGRDKGVVQLAYAIPLSALMDEGAEVDSVLLESGVTVFSGDADPLFDEIRSFTIKPGPDSHVWKDYFILEYEFLLDLKQHNITLHARVPEDNTLCGWRDVHDLSTLDGDRLMLSTLKLAFDITPATEHFDRHRDALNIVPNPTKSFRREEPIFAYYEIYNLTYDGEGQTHYTVNFTLRKAGKKGLVKRITGVFGSGEKYQVSVESDQTGASRTMTNFISFDMSKAKKGDYVMTLEVKDHVSGEQTSTVSELTLK